MNIPFEVGQKVVVTLKKNAVGGYNRPTDKQLERYAGKEGIVREINLVSFVEERKLQDGIDIKDDQYMYICIVEIDGERITIPSDLLTSI